MKPNLLTFIIALLMLTTVASADNLGYNRDHPLLFGVDMDYAPLEYVDENGMPHGLDIEFTQELLSRLQIPFTYSPNTWENISGDVLSGRVDLGMMVYSSYRKDITNYSHAVFRLYYQILYHHADKQSFNVRDLHGKRIAVMSSRPLTDTLRHAGATPVVVKSLPTAVQDLALGKYDAVICFRYQAAFLIDKYNLRQIVAEDLALTPREYCYVSHSKELIEVINAELDRMEEDGTITRIYGSAIASLSSFKIPDWVWYVVGCIVVIALVSIIIIQQRFQRRLRAEMRRAQRSEQLKTVFLGNVSHALRTPLNSIIGFSDVLSSAEPGQVSLDEQRQMLRLINGNGQQLLYFINELLELSNIEGSELLFNRSEIHLREFMEELAEAIRPTLHDGVKLVVEGGADSCVLADQTLMRLVTNHCLKNAAEHTLEGRVTLSYQTDPKGVRIEVRDTGTGLPESLRENIFSLLAERNTYVQDKVPGLGLSICKAIVDRCHGRIGAESPAGGGTVLWHWVPVKVLKP